MVSISLIGLALLAGLALAVVALLVVLFSGFGGKK